MERYDFSLQYENKTQDEILRLLKSEVARREKKPPNRLKTWTFWSGFLWGAVLVSTMDYGDIHFCVGSCDDASAFRIGAQP